MRSVANEMPPPQPVAKKIAKASGAPDFNILQNNGRIAHQVVDHVSFLVLNHELQTANKCALGPLPHGMLLMC